MSIDAQTSLAAAPAIEFTLSGRDIRRSAAQMPESPVALVLLGAWLVFAASFGFFVTLGWIDGSGVLALSAGLR